MSSVYTNIYQWNRIKKINNLIVKATSSSIYLEERIFKFYKPAIYHPNLSEKSTSSS